MWGKYLRRISIIIGTTALVAILGVVVFYFLVKAEVFGNIPDREQLKVIENAQASTVLSDDGEVIGRLFTENRTNTSFEALPDHLVDALIATEDVRFYEHEGIDRRSMMRVLIKSILLGDESAGGGSTITQQLAKNLFGRDYFGFLSMPVNKTREMILANRLEEIYSKEQIIELYFNTVPFSENVYGIETASQRFFSKQPSDLDVEEGAVLVGMLKANSYYNPRLNPENSRKRRNVVLHQMQRYDFLSAEKAENLQEKPLEIHYQNLSREAPASYFMQRIESKAKEIVDSYNQQGGDQLDLYQDGLVIQTTLNYTMQKSARNAMRQHLARLQRSFDSQYKNFNSRYAKMLDAELRQTPKFKRLQKQYAGSDSLQFYLQANAPRTLYIAGKDSVVNISVTDSVAHYLKLLRAGFLALDPQNGAVRAWVGGPSFRFLPYDHVLSKRQSASTFKPFVYATALEAGVSPCDYISNERRVYDEYEGWSPRNYNGEYGGNYSMAGALKKSVNVAAVQTIFKAGVEKVVTTARAMGIETPLENKPSIALGTQSVSLLEMTRAYATLANGGYRVEPFMIQSIKTRSGKIIYEQKAAEREKVLSDRTSALMNAMLQGVVQEGTGTALKSTYGVRGEWAGKTGTAQNYTDGWFMAYNPEIVAGSWVGAPSPQLHFRNGSLGSGSAMALPIVAKTFSKACAEDQAWCTANFPRLSSDLQSELDCPDFKEDNFFDGLKDIFKKEQGRKVDSDSSEEKKGFFERLFGGKKKDED